MAEPSEEALSADRKEEIQTRVPAPLLWHPSFLKELKSVGLGVISQMDLNSNMALIV